MGKGFAVGEDGRDRVGPGCRAGITGPAGVGPEARPAPDAADGPRPHQAGPVRAHRLGKASAIFYNYYERVRIRP